MPPRKRKFNQTRSHHDWPSVNNTEEASNEYFAALQTHSSASHAVSHSYEPVFEPPREERRDRSWNSTDPARTLDHRTLYIQAYEADVLVGAQCLDSAGALEYTQAGPGDALVRWEGGSNHTGQWPGDDDFVQIGSGHQEEPNSANDVWVDRCVYVFVMWSLPKLSLVFMPSLLCCANNVRGVLLCLHRSLERLLLKDLTTSSFETVPLFLLAS
jgi:hypothetical protein